MKGYWSRSCRTSKHLVELYQASLKEKIKMLRQICLSNVTFDDDSIDITHLDV